MPMNYTKTALLLAALTGIFIAMGAAVGGRAGIVVAFIIALFMNVMSLWKSDSVVLRMFKAREVDESAAPDLFSLVRELAGRAGLPMPRVFIMDQPQPNAFATGRSPSRAVLCASTGLLQALTREELAGVIAHELAHVKNRDTLTMTVAATIGGAVSMFAQWLQWGMLFGGSRDNDRGFGLIGTLFAALVAPLAAMMVQMAISRSREYQADRMGAIIAGNPLWLASALQKINALARQIQNPRAEQIPAAAHLFIINPLNGHGFDNLFATHPSTENRIRELEALAREMGISSASQGSVVASSDGRGARGPSSGGVWVSGQNQAGDKGPWG
jgi:heat shock protein HtpX